MAQKAYYVEEAVKGVTLLLVWADTADEAAELVRAGERGDDVDPIDTEIHPNGIRSVRREPAEDR